MIPCRICRKELPFNREKLGERGANVYCSLRCYHGERDSIAGQRSIILDEEVFALMEQSRVEEGQRRDLVLRRADSVDLLDVHALGRAIPELRVSDAEDFMTQDELLDAIRDPSGVFLVSEVDRSIDGFAYARVGDLDRAGGVDQACFVYLAVGARARRRGVGDALCRRMIVELATRGVRYVYAWAHPSSGVIPFMERHGFAAGKTCVWMERWIA